MRTTNVLTALLFALALTACSAVESGAPSAAAPADVPDPPAALDQKSGKVKAAELPAFSLRLRMLSVKGAPAPAAQTITYSFYPETGSAKAVGDQWGEPLQVALSTYEKALGPHSYPNTYMKGFPVVLHLKLAGVTDPTRVEAEATFEGRAPWKMEGELSGGVWGMLLWLDTKDQPHINSMAQYNRRFWAHLRGKEIAPADRPKFFPIVDRFIGGDTDRLAQIEGVNALASAGYSALMTPPDKASRDVLLATGNKRTAWAVYNPPGYAFDHEGVTPESITKWAHEQALPFLRAGFEKTDMAIYAMADETGWYYPQAFEPLVKNPAALQRFRDYLKSQNLSPADLGHADWSTVLPISRSKAVDLPSKRLFYWTMRFFPWDSSRHFAVSTKAMEEAFYPNMPIFDNWNFFAGRSFVPGPVANNNQKTNPDAAMGGHDWFEFARMRGGTMLWTEDWFGDQQAYQWSFYAAKLWSAARKGNIEFGAYVIPRTAGQRAFGVEQKILAVAGMGGKAIKYFVFGPEYNFPGNCYSMKPELLPKLAEAHRLIARAEPLLWPGRPPKAQVAILYPRSAQMWDAKNVSVPTMIEDATNTNLNRKTVDYMAEIFNLYLAFQHQNIAVDFVEEDDLTIDGLKDYKALYITAPNLPVENQRTLLDWVKQGGTLVTVPGAAAADRYDEPCDLLAVGTGIKRGVVPRTLIANTAALPVTGTLKFPGQHQDDLDLVCNLDSDAQNPTQAAYSPGELQLAIGDRRGMLWNKVGAGRAYHFTFFPGLSYVRTGKQPKPNDLPEGFVGGWHITRPALAAGVVRRARTAPMVETPMLVSDQGIAMTFLNWNNKPLDLFTVLMKIDFKPARIESVKKGKLKFFVNEDGLNFNMTLDADDIVLIYKN